MSEQPTRRNAPLIAKLMLVVVAMFGFGYALVPMYRVICEITGLNGYLQDGPSEVRLTGVDRSRLVTVQFVANVGEYGPWRFQPTVATMQVHPGELYTTHYTAENTRDEPVIGVARYGVSPGKAARYFAKPDCFCYSDQMFQAREKRELPVTFFIDPNLPAAVTTVTLSYTFYDARKQ
jgi:cytochrome c oxidase assembly protein subunit 11